MKSINYNVTLSDGSKVPVSGYIVDNVQGLTIAVRRDKCGQWYTDEYTTGRRACFSTFGYSTRKEAIEDFRDKLTAKGAEFVERLKAAIAKHAASPEPEAKQPTPDGEKCQPDLKPERPEAVKPEPESEPEQAAPQPEAAAPEQPATAEPQPEAEPDKPVFVEASPASYAVYQKLAGQTLNRTGYSVTLDGEAGRIKVELFPEAEEAGWDFKPVVLAAGYYFSGVSKTYNKRLNYKNFKKTLELMRALDKIMVAA